MDLDLVHARWDSAFCEESLKTKDGPVGDADCAGFFGALEVFHCRPD